MPHPIRTTARPSAGLMAVARLAVVCLGIGTMGSSCGNTPVPATVVIPGGDVEVAGKIDSHLLFSVPVTISGKGPYNFFVDTGASATFVSPRIASALRPAKGPDIPVTGFGGASSGPSTYVTIDSLGIGSMQFKNFWAIVKDVPTLTGGAYEGVIGLPVFYEVTMRIDYPRKTLRVQTSLLDQNICNRILSGADLYSDGGFDIATTTINVDGINMEAEIDTGNEEVLSLPNSFSTLPWTGALTDGTAGGAAGAFPVKRGTLNGNMGMGCLQWTKPQISLSADEKANVGAGGWQTLILLIDQRSKLMRIQKPDCPTTQDCINPDTPAICTRVDGIWSTDLGEMEFILGSPDFGFEGTFTSSCKGYVVARNPSQGAPGCADCLTLSGFWVTFNNQPDCLPSPRGLLDVPGGVVDNGPFEFVVSADFSTFTGSWAFHDADGDGQLDSNWQPWNGSHTACK